MKFTKVLNEILAYNPRSADNPRAGDYGPETYTQRQVDLVVPKNSPYSEKGKKSPKAPTDISDAVERLLISLTDLHPMKRKNKKFTFDGGTVTVTKGRITATYGKDKKVFKITPRTLALQIEELRNWLVWGK